MKKSIVILLLVTLGVMGIEIGKRPSTVILEGKMGGDSTGQAWSSQSLQGKTHLVIYMDPDKRKQIEPLLKQVKQIKHPKFSMTAIVNLAATWMPDSVLMSKLKEKKKGMNHTRYVFDKKSVLVKKWSLKDDDTVVMIFDKKGKLVYKKTGKLNHNNLSTILDIIKR